MAAARRGAVAVGVGRAVGARIHLRVNGPTVPALSVEDIRIERRRPLVPGTGTSRAVIPYTLHNRGNVTLAPAVALRAEGLFGLLERGLTRPPAELLPRQRVRLTETWDGAPQLDRAEIRLTATAKGTRESAAVTFLAVPWLLAGLLALLLTAGTALWAQARRGRTRPA